MNQDKNKILLVDDMPLSVCQIKHFIEKMGYNADMAASGEDALIKIKLNEYKMILSDLFMPGINGVTLLAKIRENLNTPFILISKLYPRECCKNAFTLEDFFMFNPTGLMPEKFLSASDFNDFSFIFQQALSSDTNDVAIAYLKARIFISRKVHDRSEEIDNLFQLGLAYKLRGRTDKARKCLDRYTSLCKKNNGIIDGRCLEIRKK